MTEQEKTLVLWTKEKREELEQYRAIGTIEEFQALKDCGTHDCIIKHLTNECSYKETGCSDCKSIEMIRTAVERMKKGE